MGAPDDDPFDAAVDLVELLPPDSLDAAQIEAWASAVLAIVDDIAGLIDAVIALPAPGADALLAGIEAVAGPALAGRAHMARRARPAVIAPSPLLAVGTAQPVDATRVRTADGTVLAVRWTHADDTGHTMLLDIDGAEVTAIRYADGGVLDALAEEEQVGLFEVESVALSSVRSELSAALRRPVHADEETWANAHLARARLLTLGVDVVPDFIEPRRVFPGVDPDPDAASFCVAVLRSAVGPPADLPAGEQQIAVRAAARVRPVEVSDATQEEADALLHLEWADWLGAVIGLVRAGPGAFARPIDLVGYVNRCPEVTTTIPKKEADHVAGCFAVATAEWADLALVADGRLTDLGRRILPAMLVEVAHRERASSVGDD